MSRAKPIRVLVVDDSASVRQALVTILSHDPDIVVIGTAPDPFVAARRIQEEIPDVITLDIEMPRMDGLTFLRKLMQQHPIPVVMCSSLTEHGSDISIQALEAGAVDVIAKPRMDAVQHLVEAGEYIREVVRGAARARVRTGRPPPVSDRHPAGIQKKLSADVMLAPPTGRGVTQATERVVCIGASTGGTEALRAVLEVLPADSPGIVVVQHMPERFTAALAKRLDGLCAVHVKEAEDGDAVLRGRVLIAPGNFHMMLNRSGGQYRVAIKQGPPVSRHRPSVDVLFRSAAHSARGNALGVIMTGMGDDGAHGLLEMRTAGAATIAQDEASCVVFGMPKEAIALGGAGRVLPLDLIATEIGRFALQPA